MQIDLGTLVVIVALAAASPLIVDVVPRSVLPVVVVEILVGIIVGPPILNLIHVTGLAQVLADFGLAFLFFLAGFELDLNQLRGMPARLALTGWGVSVALALVVAGLLEAVDVVESTLFVGVALTTTALGTLAPILRDNGDGEGRFGALVAAAGAFGEVGPIILISLLLSQTSNRGISALLLVAFGLVTGAAAFAAPRLRPVRILTVLEETLERTGQFAVRLALLILITLVYLSSRLHLDLVLGARQAADAAAPGRGRLRRLHPDLFHRHRHAVRPERDHQQRLGLTQGASVPGHVPGGARAPLPPHLPLRAGGARPGGTRPLRQHCAAAGGGRHLAGGEGRRGAGQHGGRPGRRRDGVGDGAPAIGERDPSARGSDRDPLLEQLRDVLHRVLTVLGVGDAGGGPVGLRGVRARLGLVPEHAVGAGHRLVRVGDVEVPDAVLDAGVQTQPRVHQRRLTAAEHAVDARHLPLAAREVDRPTHLAPVVPRGVGGVDHLGVLLTRTVGHLHQRPHVVEEVDRQLPPR